MFAGPFDFSPSCYSLATGSRPGHAAHVRSGALIGLLFGLLLVAANLASADSGCGGKAAANGATDAQDSSAALRVQVDPRTGELIDRPTAGAPSVSSGQSVAAPIPVTRRADGMVVADIGNRFMSETRVEIVDGEIITCHRAVTPANPPTRVANQNQAGSGNGD